MNNYYIKHHGILGQKWGDRNGPPYPLSGGDYSREEKKQLYRARLRKDSTYNKKHFDKVIEEGKVLSTLSYDKRRTKDAEMFYAAYDKRDKHQYNALFNRKIDQPIYDKDGREIGTGSFYKFRINNTASRNIKVASEDSGAKAFIDLYSTSRDFKNFVTDPNRMQARFVDSKYKFKGYREAREALDRIRNADIPSERDLRIAYRMFNYVIPSDGAGNARNAKDVATQRARVFSELKKSGYGAMLDTNDAIYGGFKANSPVIVFDMSTIVFDSAKRVTSSDKRYSEMVFAGRKVLGV